MVLDIEAKFVFGGGSRAVNTKLMTFDYIRRAKSCFRKNKTALKRKTVRSGPAKIRAS